jgi:hypothetical protein
VQIALTAGYSEFPGGSGGSFAGFFALGFGLKKDESNRRALLNLKSGDRTDETSIGSRTIFSVARTLQSSPQYERAERKA